jgi:hypothetical protein
MININPNWIQTPPTFNEFIGDDYTLKQIHDKILPITSKWSPIIENYLSFRISKESLSHLSLYIECYDIYFDTIYKITGKKQNFETIFHKILEDVKSISKKSAVIRKVFNYNTGHMEYELEDGNIITIVGEVDEPLSNIDNGVFPPEIIKIIDPIGYRHVKIDNLLK